MSQRRRLSPADYALLAEATFALGLAAPLVAFLPFRGIAAIAARAPRGRPAAGTDIARLRWAIRAAARRVPWRAKCFEQGLAAQAMLRRRGIATTLHYGVARSAGPGIIAHVWVTLDSRDVVGGENAHEFVEIVRFPRRAAVETG